MAMNSFISLISPNSIAFIIALFFLIISPSYYSYHYTFRDSVVEEKSRLGSTPPSCHNKCNNCHPCLAVQVPAQPSQRRFEPGSIPEKRLQYYSDPSIGNRYSNYKPLGWKCKCDGHYYNP